MRYNLYDIGGEVVKEDDRYIVKDNPFLNNLIISSTELKPGKSTTGHKHPGQEEVYIFSKGSAVIEIDDTELNVGPNDVVLIPDGAFHRVHAGPHGSFFVCVFDGTRSHK